MAKRFWDGLSDEQRKEYLARRGKAISDALKAKKLAKQNSEKSKEIGPDTVKINLGCGRHILPDWVNLDWISGPGVDTVANLEGCRTHRLPFDDDSADEMLLSHVIEHINDTLGLMEELHRIAKHDALLTVHTPYGSSDDAWEDPTHVRPWFVGHWNYFGQPNYWRADYGYRGDWKVEGIYLAVDPSWEGKTPDEIMDAVYHRRNFVREMVARLRAVKPIRPMEKSLQFPPKIWISFA